LICACDHRSLRRNDHPESTAWARFIVREQMDRTEAFDVPYSGVMGCLVDRLSAIIVRIDQALVFRVARATLLRAAGWTDVDPAGAESIRQIVRDHTKAILTINSREDAL
jgi:hypothetical protein